MLTTLSRFRHLWLHLGPGWLAYRAWYAASLRGGVVRRRLPLRAWGEVPLRDFLTDPALAEPERYARYRRESAPPFLFAPEDRARFAPLFEAWDAGGAGPQARAEAIGRGHFPLFEHGTADLGFPPEWHRNPLGGARLPAERHWSQIGDFGAGDIKGVWEPSRFGWAFALVRAFWRTGDERHAEGFWQLLESWLAHNPPQRGPNWKCGQETSFRLMAWCFALYGLADSAATTPARVAALAQATAVSAGRVEANLAYALSQRNNHGISEGVGLWTVGLLFPEFRGAARWRERGRAVLERLARELIYDDGSFAQHSTNYHRVMLHDYLWAIRLGDVNGQPLSDTLRARVGRAGEWLLQLQDDRSGQVPRYGQNDGALVLPLTNCDSSDFRPVTQAVQTVCSGTRPHAPGPWDEEALWLLGPASLAAPHAPPIRGDFAAPVGGYYTLRAPSGFAFVRCATFCDRPGQADMLHVDLWWRGQAIAQDAGTFSYHAPAPWDNALARTRVHNTVTVDGQDQMERAGKFLWLPWLRGEVAGRWQSAGGSLACWEGRHDGYERLAAPTRHRRAIVRLADGWWLVVDRLRSAEPHDYRLHWLLPDGPHEWDGAGHVRLDTPVGAYHVQVGLWQGAGDGSLTRAEPNTPRGWVAPYYHDRQPALSLALASRNATFHSWTLFGPAQATVTGDSARLHIEAGAWRATVRARAGDEAGPLLQEITLSGDMADRLEIG